MVSTLLNNRYRITQALSMGGFSQTFLAEDTHLPSGRRCVIKQLKPQTNDPQMFQQAQERFQREAAILEELGEGSHQIPKLYAYFSEGNQFYLVQELIEGQTLTNIVQQQGTISENSVKEILISLLPVLDYVHSKRMVHRDIKPDNIIIRQRDGKPVLIDFGAVKQSVGQTLQYPGNIAPSIMIGTPGYMASEQAAGHPVYASDFYGLGLTAIYMLTGRLPQALPADPQTGEITWHQYATAVSPGLVAVLDQAIKSHWRDRYSSAREMLAALQSINLVQPVVAPVAPNPSTVATVAISPGIQQPVSSPPQRVPATPVVVGQGQQRKPWLIAALIAGGLLAAGAAIAFLTKSPQPSPPVASSPSPTPTSSTPTINETRSPAPEPTTSPSPEARPPLISASRTPEATSSPIAETTPSPESPEERSPQIEPEESSGQGRDRENKNNNQPSNSSQSVPAFPTGTPRGRIEAVLGKPNRDTRGLWNTRAISYKYVPNQIEFGYLFDRNSGILRQTEAAFAQSVDSQVMLNTIDGLLAGRATEDIRQGLQDVYRRRRGSYTFTNGSLKGMIVRQECDMIYISIWEADLHEIDVAGGRQC